MKFNLILVPCILIIIASKCDGNAIRFIRDLNINSTAVKEAPSAVNNGIELQPMAVAGMGSPSVGVSSGVGTPVSHSIYRIAPEVYRGPQPREPAGWPTGAGGSSSGVWPSGPPSEAEIQRSHGIGQIGGPGHGGWPTARPGVVGMPGYYPPSLNNDNNYNIDGYKLCTTPIVVASNGFERNIPICVIITIPEFTPSSYAVQQQF